MRLIVVVGLLLALPSGVLRGVGPSPQSTTTFSAAERRQFLDTYCVACHNERRKANFANLAFDTLDVQQIGDSPAVWEKVIKKLRVGAMPPVGQKRPSAESYAAFVASLEGGLGHGAE